MTTGIGRCDMILRRKVMPSMRGISTSSVMTSGTSFWIRLAAAKGSVAVPTTSISLSPPRMSAMVCRTEAESSTTKTRILRLAPLTVFLRSSFVPQHRRGHGLHLGEVAPGGGFRMAEEEIAAGPEMGAEALENVVLGLAVEVDEDVAAENDIHVPAGWIVRLHQVEPAEAHQAAQLGYDPRRPPRRIPRSHHVALAQRGGHRLQHLLGVDAKHRLLQNFGADIGAEDRETEPAEAQRLVRQDHGERIRFRAVRAGCAPRLDTAVIVGAIRQKRRQRLSPQEVEMLRFAKKVRFVGRDL